MEHQNQKRSRIEVEILDQRCLLAGNVTASVVCGELQVVGDSQSNEIYIYQTTSGGFRVLGQNETTVNGGAFFQTASAPHDVSVSMREGADGVNLTFAICGDLTVHTGVGSDFVNFVEYLGEAPEGADPEVLPLVGNDLTITTGADNDTLFFLNSTVGDDAFVSTGLGDDFVIMSTTPEFGDDLTIWTGDGTDTVDIFGITVAGDTEILMGAGDDLLSIADSIFEDDVELRGGMGNDVFVNGFQGAENEFLGNLIVVGFETV